MLTWEKKNIQPVRKLHKEQDTEFIRPFSQEGEGGGGGLTDGILLLNGGQCESETQNLELL